jgi:hypothetical protein
MLSAHLYAPMLALMAALVTASFTSLGAPWFMCICDSVTVGGLVYFVVRWISEMIEEFYKLLQRRSGS